MRFSFSEDQLAMAAALDDMLRRECPPSRVRAAWEDETGHAPELWARLGEMGVLSMCMPESVGGMGGNEIDLVLLLEACGRAAVPGPIVEHAAVAAPAMAATAHGPGLANGSVVATAWLAPAPYVAHAHVADVIYTSGEAITGHRSLVQPIEGLDGGRRLFTLPVSTDAGNDNPLDFDRGAVGTAAYLVGLGDTMLTIAGDYARQREQFGKPIGSFQAVKHLMANALLKVEFAKPALYRAAWSVATNSDERARDVSMAKVFANEAAAAAAKASIQVHGAMGYTWECDVQLYAKKAWALSRAHGDNRFHRRRVADSVLSRNDFRVA
jgi:alkylation response protein AidB-like acyl-CoA dehydrogenase